MSLRNVKRNPAKTWHTGASGPSVVQSTVHQSLVRNGFSAGVAVKKPRLSFAKLHKNWGENQWQQVVWSRTCLDWQHQFFSMTTISNTLPMQQNIPGYIHICSGAPRARTLTLLKRCEIIWTENRTKGSFFNRCSCRLVKERTKKLS